MLKRNFSSMAMRLAEIVIGSIFGNRERQANEPEAIEEN